MKYYLDICVALWNPPRSCNAYPRFEVISDGDLAHPIESLVADEFGSFAKYFNDMTNAFCEAQILLEQKVKEQTADIQHQK